QIYKWRLSPPPQVPGILPQAPQPRTRRIKSPPFAVGKPRQRNWPESEKDRAWHHQMGEIGNESSRWAGSRFHTRYPEPYPSTMPWFAQTDKDPDHSAAAAP